MSRLTPTVSAVIPTYNRAHVVGRAIKSVLGQTCWDFELIVVDDGSTDDTEAVVHSIEDNRIRYLRQDNKGASAARNTGIRAARGEYIAFLDSDDEWLPRKLEAQLKVFEETEWPNLGVVMCGFMIAREDGVREMAAVNLRGDIYREALLRRINTTASVIMVRRSAWREPPMFDEDLVCAEDWDYIICASRDSQIDFVTEPLVKLDRQKSERLTDLIDDRIAGLLRILEKNDGYLKKHPYLLMTYHHGLAGQLYLYRRWSGIRRHAIKALMACPRHPAAYVWLLGAFCGPLGIRAASKLYPAKRRPL